MGVGGCVGSAAAAAAAGAVYVVCGASRPWAWQFCDTYSALSPSAAIFFRQSGLMPSRRLVAAVPCGGAGIVCKGLAYRHSEGVYTSMCI